jgi:hypothetical protein
MWQRKEEKFQNIPEFRASMYRISGLTEEDYIQEEDRNSQKEKLSCVPNE